ncbi:MAG TPA: CHAT domain-containing tetratricopeptide repeat protein, partial [Candidatus Kapabacteria bacterium]|nr:CHAT domain-containing tetratricopeptide repeat protein [Candidatus Kapabacteria bacterium]
TNPDSVTAYLHYELGAFTLELANYSNAEEELLEAKALYAKLYSEHHESVASALSRLAVLYSEQGRYADAVAAASEQLNDYKLSFGNEDRFTALAGIAVSEYKLQAKDIIGAQQLSTMYLPIIAKAYPKQSIEAARSKKLQGLITFLKHDFKQSENFFSEAMNSLPPERPVPSLRGAIELERARSRSILAKDNEALADIKSAIIDITTSRNAQTLLIAKCYLIAGSICEMNDKMDSSQKNYERALDIYKAATKENFRYSSERERLSFIRDIKLNSGRVFSTVLRSKLVDPAIASLGYNWLLFQKGLLLSSIQAIRSSSRNARDTSIVRVLDRIAELRSRRSAFVTKDKLLLQKPYYNFDSIDKAISTLEKQLVKKSASYTRFSALGSANWSIVRNKLSNDDCAIELSTFPYYDGERLTDSNYYAAFLIKKIDSLYPKAISLGASAGLEDPAVIHSYNRYIRDCDNEHKKAAKQLTKLLWSPLTEPIGSAKTVYVSPDGIYSRFSLASFLLEDNTLLMDKYSITTLANTADLLRDTFSYSPTIAIVAGADFGKIVSKKSLPALPGTLTEATEIASVFTKTNWQATSLTSKAASEQAIRALHHPSILHIATHGKFKPSDSETADIDDLLQSSLYFSGANTTLASGSRNPENDGVLSGLEAMDLDLEGTSLVTLSACESGLGTIEPGEGVFGFPRAFRIAGASNVLMSLWPIPDKETAELMELFYKNLSEGKPKAEALRDAQRSMRQIIKKRYNEDRPQYWAGFVLYGF